MSISKWMDKEVLIHIHNGILLSYKKKCIWVSSNEVDETGAYYTKWNKSERERQILYINAYIWNLDGEGNGTPLQYSCLENPRDGGAKWAAICGVAQSRTWLKWLSMEFRKTVTTMKSSKGDKDIKNRLLDSAGKGDVGWFERIALKHVHYHM